MPWLEPKTNWDKDTDRFEAEDYNRIKGNLNYLHERAQELYRKFEIEDMGSDKEKGPSFFYADEFNAFEQNLETINQIVFTQNYGESQAFYENGPFIDYAELNRIESAIFSMFDILNRQELGLIKLSFRLGNMKGIKS